MIYSVLGLVTLLSSAVTTLAVDPKTAEAYSYNITSSSADQEIVQGYEKEGRGGWVSYKQCDSAWANQQLGYCSLTICSAGCAMSSVAMILSTKGAWYNPGQLDSWLTNNGGYANGCDIYWGSVDALGVTSYRGMQTASESEICNGLSQGHGIVANVNNGGHWVLLTGCQGGGVFTVNDPGYNRGTYSMSEILREAVYW